MEYELKLDDLLKSLTELGINTDKLTIVEKSEKFDEQEFINDYRNSKVSYIQNINSIWERKQTDMDRRELRKHSLVWLQRP